MLRNHPQPHASTPHARRALLAAATMALLVAALAVANLQAKYVSVQDRPAEMLADEFHVSSAYLAEVPTGGTTPTYTLTPVGADGECTIDLHNWEVENTAQVSDLDVTYTITVEGGAMRPTAEDGVWVSLDVGDAPMIAKQYAEHVEGEEGKWLLKYSDLPTQATLGDDFYPGYKLEGWYLSSSYNSKITGDVVVTSRNATVYAKWSPQVVPYTVQVWLEGGDGAPGEGTYAPATASDGVTVGGAAAGSGAAEGLAGSAPSVSGTNRNAYGVDLGALVSVSGGAGVTVSAERYVFDAEATAEANAGATLAGDGSTVVRVCLRRDWWDVWYFPGWAPPASDSESDYDARDDKVHLGAAKWGQDNSGWDRAVPSIWLDISRSEWASSNGSGVRQSPMPYPTSLSGGDWHGRAGGRAWITSMERGDSDAYVYRYRELRWGEEPAAGAETVEAGGVTAELYSTLMAGRVASTTFPTNATEGYRVGWASLSRGGLREVTEAQASADTYRIERDVTTRGPDPGFFASVEVLREYAVQPSLPGDHALPDAAAVRYTHPLSEVAGLGSFSDVRTGATYGEESPFVGWYDSEEAARAVAEGYGDFSDASAVAGSAYRANGSVDPASYAMPPRSLALYAGWDAPEFRVTYESNGGSPVADPNASRGYHAGDLVERPESPARDGYMFGGWYKDKSLSAAWDFAVDRVANEDITLYAKWSKGNVDDKHAVTDEDDEDVVVDENGLRMIAETAATTHTMHLVPYTDEHGVAKPMSVIVTATYRTADGTDTYTKVLQGTFDSRRVAVAQVESDEGTVWRVSTNQFAGTLAVAWEPGASGLALVPPSGWDYDSATRTCTRKVEKNQTFDLDFIGDVADWRVSYDAVDSATLVFE